MNLRGGAIIIGSLLWDNNERQEWRTDNLCQENRFQVYIPIRYGRCSSNRKNTYTMVFSNECYSKDVGLGKGWILPLKVKINSFDDLKIQAKEMGKAEGFDDGFSNTWGATALILNPNKDIDESIRDEWEKLMGSKLNNHPLLSTKLKTEKSPIDCNGFLSINWPDEVNSKNIINELDLLIATATKPSLTDGQYPTVDQIADAMNKANYYEYFLENIKNEITTFQDEEILRRIHKTKLK